MSITYQLFGSVVSVAFWNGRVGPLKNHANNKYVALSNLANGFFFSIGWLYAQWGLIEAGALIYQASPIAADALFYAGNMSWISLTPIALAILVSARGIADFIGGSNAEAYQRGAFLEDNVIRLLPGSDQLIQFMLFATKPMAQVAITVSACAVAYFAGGYLAMGLAAYTVLDTLCKLQLLSQSLQHLNARLTQGFFGFTLLSSETVICGLKLIYNAIFNVDIKPLIGLDSLVSFAKVDLTKTHDLELHPQTQLINDVSGVTIDTKHIRPATLPKSLGGIKLDKINFEDQVAALWESMEGNLEEHVVKREIANEQTIYNNWRKQRPDSFELQKEFLREGHRMCIETLAAQRRAGDSRQEDLAKAAAAAVTIQQSREGRLAKHSFLVTLGITGHFCPTRKGEGIDSLVSGYLSESADKLSTKIEGVLRDKRSELFQEHFVGALLSNHRNHFGPGRACDLRNVHYKYALVYVAGLDLGLHEHWGAHNEVKEFGSDTVRAVKAIYDCTDCRAAARAAFDAAYSKDCILETVQKSIASGNNGTLKLAEVEAWFTNWLIQREVVRLESADRAEVARIEQAITQNARQVDVQLDETQDPSAQKATALAQLIQPSMGAADRFFVEALAREYYQNGEDADYSRAYLHAKATHKFQDKGCNYLDDKMTQLAPEQTWIATMLAEMGILKNT